MAGLLVSRVTLMFTTKDSEKAMDFATLILTLTTITVILLMPLNTTQSISKEVNPDNSIPTHELRSPEDNLKAWQWMTVSWMSPLMSMGSARKLNEEDVWSLGYEFQHKRLHEQFRELKGSVVRRLLAANGLDLIFISTLAVVGCLASTK